MKKQTMADLSLILVTFFWGASYYLVDLAMKEMGPLTLNAYRFLIAFIVAGVIAFKYLKDVNKTTLKYSALVGGALFLVYVCVNLGVQRTTLSNAGFLCALTVIITPLLEIIFLKRKLTAKIEISVAMSLLGIVLLTLKENFSINYANLLGDILCMGCGFFYAIDLLLTERAVSSEKVNPFQLGVFQLLFAGLLNLIAAFAFEKPGLPVDNKVTISVLFLAIFCTGAAFIIQAVAQKYTKANRVGIIFTLEPVFSAVVAYLLAGEVLGAQGYVGAALMVAALLFMESNFKFLESKKSKAKKTKI
ncbi:MAG: DMT family transporter [Peptostreptococcaceae bacterium]|nr:DMT family transporter [Peptostreptococcaceae bacterium]MDY5738873.1 DMT family transporter [Anaerovoracaceae bacterium]